MCDNCIKEKREASGGCTELSCAYHGKKNREIHEKYHGEIESRHDWKQNTTIMDDIQEYECTKCGITVAGEKATSLMDTKCEGDRDDKM